jgi:hypothetical protein
VYRNPTFPGRELLNKSSDEVISLWEYETDLDFNDMFPSEMPRHVQMKGTPIVFWIDKLL